MTNPRISIILRTYNEARSIRRTLECVLGQVQPPEEILIVDSGSTDDTVTIAQSFAPVRVTTIPRNRFTFGYALNVGCEKATGDVLVSLSAHAFPVDDTWLLYLTRPLATENIAGVYGRQLPHPDAWPPVQRDYGDAYSVYPRCQSQAGSPADHFFSNANAAFWRQCWLQQPFDSTLPYSEDLEWARVMLQKGYSIYYEPRAAVYHSHNESLRKVFRRARHEQMSYRQLYPSSTNVASILSHTWRCYRMDVFFILHSQHSLGWVFGALVLRGAWMMGRLAAVIR